MSDLDRCAGHEKGIFLNAERQRDVDELSGPQPRVIIGECRLQGNRAGRDIDLTIDKRKYSGDRHLGLVRDRHNHGEAFRRHRGTDVRKVPFRHSEGDIDGPKLRDGNQRYSLLCGVI